jgi:phosphoglycolate phosphatase
MKISLGILTSNSLENVAAWLEHNKIQNLFSFIHVESNYFGKKHVLRKIIKAYQIDKSQAFYIGDETRDIKAAKECGIYSIAVTWGFNSEKILSQQQPHYIARKPEDILNYPQIKNNI